MTGWGRLMKRPIDKGLNKMVISERSTKRPTEKIKNMANSEAEFKKEEQKWPTEKCQQKGQ